jgi:hypothetical protein
MYRERCVRVMGKIPYCEEHKIPLADGRCPLCRDRNGDPFVLDMQSIYLDEPPRSTGEVRLQHCPDDCQYCKEAEENNPRYLWILLASLCFGGALALWQPIHTWLHAHLELLLGILIGSLLELAVVCGPRALRWIRDRWLWMKWFSL